MSAAGAGGKDARGASEDWALAALPPSATEIRSDFRTIRWSHRDIAFSHSLGVAAAGAGGAGSAPRGSSTKSVALFQLVAKTRRRVSVACTARPTS